MRINWRKTGIGLLLVGTVLAGLCGALGAREYVNRSLASEISRLRAGEDEIEVIVANRPLRVGERIGKENVALRSIPVTYLDHLSIKATDFERVSGRYLMFPVDAGKPLLLSHIAQASAAGFAERLPENQRGVTFSVDSNDTLSGLLKPGDWVDILLTYDVAGKSKTVLLLENVRILATGDDLGFDITDRERRFHEVTVALSPKDTARLIHAESLGTFNVVLRAPESAGQGFAGEINHDNLLGTPRSIRERPIAIITGRGNQS